MDKNVEKFTIEEEFETMQRRQMELRAKLTELETRRDEMVGKLIDEKDSDELESIKKKISSIRKVINDVSKEISENSKILKMYEEERIRKIETFQGNVSMLSTLISTLGALGLGIWSAGKIYKTDISSELYNKGIRDFLIRLNPFKIKS